LLSIESSILEELLFLASNKRILQNGLYLGVICSRDQRARITRSIHKTNKKSEKNSKLNLILPTSKRSPSPIPQKIQTIKKISIIPSNILIWEEKKHCVFFLKITPKTETIKKKFLDFICLIINIKNKANGMLENHRKHICWCGKRFENLFAFIALCCAREQGRS